MFRATYFYTYSSFKRLWNDSNVFVPNSAMVHMISAGGAGIIFIFYYFFYFFLGFVTATTINPVWLVKTRLQLHRGPMNVWTCVKRIYKHERLRGFYKVYFFFKLNNIKNYFLGCNCIVYGHFRDNYSVCSLRIFSVYNQFGFIKFKKTRKY